MNTAIGGRITERFPDRYLALWPGTIETIPFLHYTPGGKYLLLSTIGCNLSCQGCVSHILAKHPDLVQDSLQHVSSDEVLTKVREHSCLGAIFCLNEPAVSLGTLIRIAHRLKGAGFRIGCASNGCMSQGTVDSLVQNLDFINIGMKGSSDEVYRECDAPCTVDQVFENIRAFESAGVHLEVSVVYRRGKEDEVYGVAEKISQISPDIPLHIMRFVPFEGVSEIYEPSQEEAEHMLTVCRQNLRWVYLFNTPGTQHLSTWCPDCGNLLIERGFNGPMGAKLSHTVTKTTCSCGTQVPVKGQISDTFFSEPRFRGGYRTSVLLDLIYDTFRMVDVTDSGQIRSALSRALRGCNLEELQVLLSTPAGYITYLNTLSSWSETSAFHSLISFLERRIGEIQECTKSLEHPRVYCAMSHPLLPMYPDKMENALVTVAGGNVLNYSLTYVEQNPEPFTPEEFQAMQPEVIIISGPGSQNTQTFLDYCRKDKLTAPAFDQSAVYRIPKEYLKIGPFWFLAILWVANLLHPDTCSFDMEAEEKTLRSLLPGLQSHTD